jgi:hypothetical protein
MAREEILVFGWQKTLCICSMQVLSKIFKDRIWDPFMTITNRKKQKKVTYYVFLVFK